MVELKSRVTLILLAFFVPGILSLSRPFSSLKGKTALVTGSSGGLGAGIAVALAQQGANVVVHYHTRYQGALQTKQRILDDGGICCALVQCDFRSTTAIRDMCAKLEKEKLVPNILINKAGIVTKLASDDDDEDLSAWHETMQVNLHAPLQLSRWMHSSSIDKSGVIVNVSSIHGSRSVEWMTAYAASKAALDSLTRGLALEYSSDSNIRVNGIAPGVVPVERTMDILSQPQSQDMWKPHLPVGRMGTIEDIADATIQLCTNEWMTGTILTIDGGMMSRANMPFRPRPAKPTTSSESNISSKICFE